MAHLKTVITGTGSFIPSDIKTNHDFISSHFYDENRKPISAQPAEIVSKFSRITGIEERRYACGEMTTSSIAARAAELAIADAFADRESIDQLIVAHNFGDVIKHTIQTDAVPSIASRVKHALQIHNPSCIPYDLLFGCPGWLQGLIQADAFLKAGLAKKCLVIGAETLSRVIDPYDRDSMIFSDGAGACLVELQETGEQGSGIIGTSMQSNSLDEVEYINMGSSYLPGADKDIRYIKMKGRKVYEYALKQVPAAMKTCLDNSGIPITSIAKIFIHQANEKMDEAIVKALYKLYSIDDVPAQIMPMNIRELGNSSVATIPTLLDMVRKEKISGHRLHQGDIILFASVGAGMNINAICYRV